MIALALLARCRPVLSVAACGGDDGVVRYRGAWPACRSAAAPRHRPAPPQDAHISHEDGRWLIRFSTILSTSGTATSSCGRCETDVAGRSTRTCRTPKAGRRCIGTPAKLVWGGDGHDHWHVDESRSAASFRSAKEESAGGRDGCGGHESRILLLRPFATARRRRAECSATHAYPAATRTMLSSVMGLS